MQKKLLERMACKKRLVGEEIHKESGFTVKKLSNFIVSRENIENASDCNSRSIGRKEISWEWAELYFVTCNNCHVDKDFFGLPLEKTIESATAWHHSHLSNAH